MNPKDIFISLTANRTESLYNTECHLCLLKWSVTARVNRSISGVRGACTHVPAGHTSNAILNTLKMIKTAVDTTEV